MHLNSAGPLGPGVKGGGTTGTVGSGLTVTLPSARVGEGPLAPQTAGPIDTGGPGILVRGFTLIHIDSH